MNVIDTLSGGDILKMEAVTKLPAVMCLTYLSYKKEINNLNE